MTERETMYWIRNNLSPFISESVKGTIYTEDWIGGMVMRETGILIMRYSQARVFPKTIHEMMKGDYGQRKGELEKSYHGFGYMQIDIGSYPEFVKSGEWKDPAKVFPFALKVLEEKRIYLQSHAVFSDPELLNKAITAAYNCGQGNVLKALANNKDVDTYTFNHDYVKEIWRFREIYQRL